MIRKYAEIFRWKNVSSFCSAKAPPTHIFSAKNIRILYIESAKTVNEMTLNELVKLTTLWTTGPRCIETGSTGHCLNLRSSDNGTLYVPKSRTSLYNGSFSCSAPRLWKDLPQCVKDASTLNTVEPRYLELAYFELPLISKWKSGPCFNMKLWQQVTK